MINNINLGWTLLHSLWQAAIIFGMTKIALSLIAKHKSTLRYMINCCALLLIVMTSLSTFLYLVSSGTSVEAISPALRPTFNSLPAGEVIAIEYPIWNNLIRIINDQMVWVIYAWMAGVLIFSIRFAGGIVYIQFLKRKISDASSEYLQMVQHLSDQLRLTQKVRLVESIQISKPIVLGYIKPMIILPIGLLTGLPTSQIETILLHELAHIKRHDYLVNLIQAFIEVILFFNPFVWLLSEMIRKEREYCCDDLVIMMGSSRTEYIKALAQLEEINQYRIPTLALALNNNKYQVFNRIKRIMETTANQNQRKAKPYLLVALMAIGLLCASWLTIGEGNDDHGSQLTNNSHFISSDTTRKEKNKDVSKDKKSASYSRKVITTYGEDGTPHEEVIENFEGDEELRPILSNPGSFSFVMPDIPSIPSMPGIPNIPPTPAIPPVPYTKGFNFSFDGDTIPGKYFFSEEDEDRWEAFGREMEKRFEHFGEEHEDFGKKMEEWGKTFGDEFAARFERDFEDKMEAWGHQFDDMDFNHDFNFKLDEGMKKMEKHLEGVHERLKEHEAELKKLEGRMKEFETALQDQLIQDGYIKKGEKIESMNWSNGKLKVNGVQIKDKDVPKYEALTDKYFKGNRGFYYKN